MQWLFLSIAIISEVIATSVLKPSNGFTQLWPSLVVVAATPLPSFSCLLPYAQSRWNRVRYLICRRYRAYQAFAWLALRQTLDGPAMLGLALILAGVIVLNVFSKSVIR